MQTLIHVYCKTGSSLRERIAKDPRLDRHNLYVVKEYQPGRSPGWLKLRSTDAERRGAINLEWDSEGVLRCRVVNRGGGKPSSICRGLPRGRHRALLAMREDHHDRAELIATNLKVCPTPVSAAVVGQTLQVCQARDPYLASPITGNVPVSGTPIAPDGM